MVRHRQHRQLNENVVHKNYALTKSEKKYMGIYSLKNVKYEPRQNKYIYAD
jgi:hypothetical protein